MALTRHRPPLEKNRRRKQKRPRPLHRPKQRWGDTGGTTDKQIGFLKLLADRVGADYAEDIWRAADRKRLQTQIAAAKPFKKGNHTHAAREEVIFRIGVENKIGYKEGVQRCECGAARSAIVDRAGVVTIASPWVLSGYLVDYLVAYDTLEGQ